MNAVFDIFYGVVADHLEDGKMPELGGPDKAIADSVEYSENFSIKWNGKMYSILGVKLKLQFSEGSQPKSFAETLLAAGDEVVYYVSPVAAAELFLMRQVEQSIDMLEFASTQEVFFSEKVGLDNIIARSSKISTKPAKNLFKLVSYDPDTGDCEFCNAYGFVGSDLVSKNFWHVDIRNQDTLGEPIECGGPGANFLAFCCFPEGSYRVGFKGGKFFTKKKPVYGITNVNLDSKLPYIGKYTVSRETTDFCNCSLKTDVVDGVETSSPYFFTDHLIEGEPDHKVVEVGFFDVLLIIEAIVAILAIIAIGIVDCLEFAEWVMTMVIHIGLGDIILMMFTGVCSGIEHVHKGTKSPFFSVPIKKGKRFKAHEVFLDRGYRMTGSVEDIPT